MLCFVPPGSWVRVYHREFSKVADAIFTENFSTTFSKSIREQNEFFGVAEDGRLPFISAQDIAQATYDALVSKESPNKDYYIVGPELFSYDEASKSKLESPCMSAER